MEDATCDPYFFWGSPDPDQFGLYSPLFNKFLLVDDSIQALEYVLFLLSSKISLFIIPISKASNFEHTLIDNTCCLNWGVAEWSLLPRIISRRSFYGLDVCVKLSMQQSQPTDSEVKLHKLSFLIKHTVDFFKFNENVLYSKFFDLISSPFENNDFLYVKEQERKCFDLLYLSYCREDTETKIKNILNDQKLINIIHR